MVGEAAGWPSAHAQHVSRAHQPAPAVRQDRVPQPHDIWKRELLRQQERDPSKREELVRYLQGSNHTEAKCARLKAGLRGHESVKSRFAAKNGRPAQPTARSTAQRRAESSAPWPRFRGGLRPLGLRGPSQPRAPATCPSRPSRCRQAFDRSSLCGQQHARSTVMRRAADRSAGGWSECVSRY